MKLRQLIEDSGKLLAFQGRRGTLLAVGLGLSTLTGWIALIANTGRYPVGDGPHNIGVAMRLSQLLWDLDLGTFYWCFQSLLAPHPPGAYVPALLAFFLVGTGTAWGHLLAGAMGLGLIMDALRRFGGGLTSWIWLFATGLVWQQAEIYSIDLLAAAAVAQSLSHLHASEKLERRGHVLGWGAWMGAAFMIKYTAPFFLFLPCLLVGVWVVRHRRWRALGLGALAWSVVALPWYLTHLDQVLAYVLINADADGLMVTDSIRVTSAWWAGERISRYPAALIDAFGWPGVACLLAGLVVYKRSDAQRLSAWALPGLAILGGWAVLNGQMWMEDRYMLPLIPLLAVLAGTSRIRALLAPVGAIGLCGALSVFATIGSYSTGFEAHSIQDAGADWPSVHEAHRPGSLDPEEWKLDEGLRIAREAHGSDEGTVGLMLDLPNAASGFGVVLNRTTALGYRWHLATVVMNVDGGALQGAPEGSTYVFMGPFTHENWPSRDFSTVLAIFRSGDAKREAWLHSQDLALVESWPLEDGWVGGVYKARQGVIQGASPPPVQ